MILPSLALSVSRPHSSSLLLLLSSSTTMRSAAVSSSVLFGTSSIATPVVAWGLVAPWSSATRKVVPTLQLCSSRGAIIGLPPPLPPFRRCTSGTALSVDSVDADADSIGQATEVNGDSDIQYTKANVKVSMPPPPPPLTHPLSSNFGTYLPLARDMMDYIDNSPDPFHAVANAVTHLESAGFVEWKDKGEDEDHSSMEEIATLQPGGKYYFTRNKSTLVAFAIGARYDPKKQRGPRFKIIGAHTDSPNLKVKPRSKRTVAPTGGSSGMMQLAVECYGGGLWHTWFDRDLGVSGRVFLRETENKDDDNDNTRQNSRGRIRQVLVKVHRAVLRIPNLAIHLQTMKEREAFEINKEDHLIPIIATVAAKSLGSDDDTNNKNTDDEWRKYQEPLLLQLLASELNVNPMDIVDFELNLFDVQPASFGGVHSEFIHSSRLDNLASCFLAYRGLIDHVVGTNGLDEDADISMVAMFDHEEVGSASATGAGSPIVGEAVQRISHTLQSSSSDGDIVITNPSYYDRTIRRSFCLSVDMAHAVHPNYASKHEKGHGPTLNGGMVIKRNSNQRYATNAVTALLMRELARSAELPLIQEFVVRNDCGCGSTIGPIISANTGIRALDIGCPQLSMHSIRETMGVKDLNDGLKLFNAYFRDFAAIDGSIEA